jgi:ABC-type cobalt transport system substrate-binding protein
MNSLARWCTVAIVSAVVLFIFVFVFVFVFVGAEGRAAEPIPSGPSAADASKPASCATPEYRQFDFWIGDWDAFDVDNPTIKTARNHVDPILDGCVLREDYEGADGHKGQSFSIYDASRKVWHQSWVTNRGELLVIEGKFEAGEMVLSGVDRNAAGQPLVRGIWKPVDGAVRETAVTSTDGGKTWKPWFDLVFRPHKP